MVNPPFIEVRLAELRDVPGLTALEARYYIGNVDPADRAGGFISVLHSTEWFAAAVDSGGVHVAVTEDDAVAGFIVMTAPPDRAPAGLSPIIRTMLELAETVEMNGRPIAAARYAFAGRSASTNQCGARGVLGFQRRHPGDLPGSIRTRRALRRSGQFTIAAHHHVHTRCAIASRVRGRWTALPLPGLRLRVTPGDQRGGFPPVTPSAYQLA